RLFDSNNVSDPTDPPTLTPKSDPTDPPTLTPKSDPAASDRSGIKMKNSTPHEGRIGNGKGTSSKQESRDATANTSPHMNNKSASSLGLSAVSLLVSLSFLV
ncbi:hypothetical protein GCK32_019069, partial [Trichostrongylus colubriformis]